MRIPALPGTLTWSSEHYPPGNDIFDCYFMVRPDNPDIPRLLSACLPNNPAAARWGGPAIPSSDVQTRMEAGVLRVETQNFNASYSSLTQLADEVRRLVQANQDQTADLRDEYRSVHLDIVPSRASVDSGLRQVCDLPVALIKAISASRRTYRLGHQSGGLETEYEGTYLVHCQATERVTSLDRLIASVARDLNLALKHFSVTEGFAADLP